MAGLQIDDGTRGSPRTMVQVKDSWARPRARQVTPPSIWQMNSHHTRPRMPQRRPHRSEIQPPAKPANAHAQHRWAGLKPGACDLVRAVRCCAWVSATDSHR